VATWQLTVDPHWAALAGVTGDELIAIFRGHKDDGWIEYGLNQYGVSFGCDIYDGSVGFVTIPEGSDPLPQDVVQSVANESGLWLDGLAEWVATWRQAR
jgi:hypothetical protein